MYDSLQSIAGSQLDLRRGIIFSARLVGDMDLWVLTPFLQTSSQLSSAKDYADYPSVLLYTFKSQVQCYEPREI
jgi:hypothetical protein